MGRTLLSVLCGAIVGGAGTAWWLGRDSPRVEALDFGTSRETADGGAALQRPVSDQGFRTDLALEDRLSRLESEESALRDENRGLTERLDAYEAEERERDGARRAIEPTRVRLAELDPGQFGDLTVDELLHLRNLDLSELEIADEDLALFADLPALERLNLRRTEVTAAGLAHLVDAPGLENLGLRETPITDLALDPISRMPALEWLDLNMTAVTNDGLARLAGNRRIEFLRLNYTQVTNEGLHHLATLTALERVDLWGTTATDAGLTHLWGHPSLNHLELGATAVTEEWVESFQAAHPDCYVRSAFGR